MCVLCPAISSGIAAESRGRRGARQGGPVASRGSQLLQVAYPRAGRVAWLCRALRPAHGSRIAVIYSGVDGGCVARLIMASLLLETKLYVPRRRRGLVGRPRLSERLNRGAESKLTLVSAPAGFGKTTLLTEWLDFFKHSAGWVSLDQSDNHAA